jgi:hypothetical protein
MDDRKGSVQFGLPGGLDVPSPVEFKLAKKSEASPIQWFNITCCKPPGGVILRRVTELGQQHYMLLAANEEGHTRVIAFRGVVRCPWCPRFHNLASSPAGAGIMEAVWLTQMQAIDAMNGGTP